MDDEKGKGRSVAARIMRVALKTFIILLLVVIVLPALLYVPFVQDFAVGIASRKLSEATGMNIGVGQLRLRFPLRVELSRVNAVEASGDTLVAVGRVNAGMKLLPLLHGEAVVENADLEDAYYRMGTPDSVMYLTARVDRVSVGAGSWMNFKKGVIDVDCADLSGGRVWLAMKDTVVATPPDTASTANALRIRARRVTLTDVSYSMTMLPVIDSLGAHIDRAELTDGRVDLGRRTVSATSLRVDSVTATYLTPSLAYLKAHPAKADTTAATTASADSLLWTVTADSVRVTARSATYAMRDARPLPGFDVNYISATGIDIAVDSVYNRGAAVSGAIRRIRARERCGLEAGLTGRFDMDTTAIRAEGMTLTLQRSMLKLDGMMGMGDLLADPTLPLSLKAEGYISPADATLAMPMIGPMLRNLPRGVDLRLKADVQGTPARLDVAGISASLGTLLSLNARGSVFSPFDPAKIGGRINLEGNIRDANFIKPTLLDAQTARTVNIPPTRLNGFIDYKPGVAEGRLRAVTAGGQLAADGSWQARGERYTAHVDVDRLNVAAIMPTLGVGPVTATLDVTGHGYNPLSATTVMDVDLDLRHAEYMKKDYNDITLTASLSDGHAKGEIVSNNPDFDMDADFTATLSPGGYTWEVDGDLHRVDLMALNLSETPMSGTVSLLTTGSMSADLSRADARVSLRDLDWEMDTRRIEADTIDLLLRADSTTYVELTSDDLKAIANVRTGLKGLMDVAPRVMAVKDSLLRTHHADIPMIEHALPQMEMAVSVGSNNFASRYLAADGTRFNRATLTFTNDSLLHLAARVNGFVTGTTRLDTLRLDANQKGEYLLFSGALNQRPGTMDDFAHVGINGFVSAKQLSMLVRQRNIEQKEGYMIGMNVTASDSTIDVRFVPRKPTIAYKKWSINPDNFVTYNFRHPSIAANLTLENDQQSYLKLFTVNETDAPDQEDVVLQLNNIQIQDWIAINPFAPPIKGAVGANLRFHILPEGITGKGDVAIDDLYYGRERVGSFGIDLNVNQSRGGVLNADMALMVDSVKVITATGALNDSTKSNPFLLDFSMIKFPLQVANPFLPKEYARLSGTLNGRMDITGSMTEPIFNGTLQFDSAACKVGMLGSTFTFAPTEIPVDSNIVRFNDFTIKAVNNNPLHVDGIVDARSLVNPRIRLGLTARDMQIVGSTRPKGADVYGKAFVDLDAKLNGNMQYMEVDADLNVLPGTNVTYILASEAAAIVNQSTGNMVQFVVFADSTQTAAADSVASDALNLNLEANLIVSEGSTISVDLNTDGTNKVQIQGAGNLTYTQNPMNDGRLTGRFNINDGFVRYTPPLMSEKLFNFQEGSYISFTGDIMNPILNVHAVDQLKANVTQSGQDSRLVNFDVSLAVTNTLENMNVKFDLSTNDDLTVQNELSSMSPEQRANQAMNMLLYNVYTGAGTKASANLSGNPLYSFLESRLNAWAASNIKGVDLSFGIDQYDRTVNGNTSSTMSYSYKVSKTLFNDRVKIIVGGNYSTDADADENFAENLINDISFEYMLNRSGSMYVRIFRHVGFESILEGEITQTGVGFVMKRKLNTLRDLFRFLPRHASAPPQSVAVTPPLSAPATPPAPEKDEKPTAVKPSKQAIKNENE